MQKILIVDDQLEVRKLVEATLRIGDFEIIQAASGDEALAIARIEKPDLILLDVRRSSPPNKGSNLHRLSARWGNSAGRLTTSSPSQGCSASRVN